MLESILFYAFSLLVVTSLAMVITVKNSVHSVLVLLFLFHCNMFTNFFKK